MNKLIVALALATAAGATPVLAGDVGISISIGEPGFFGQLVIGDADRPRVIDARPVEVVHRYRNLAPIYLRVPDEQRRNWRRFCDRYNACARPVLFVRDDWYRNEYAPRYRKEHGNDRHDDHGRGDDNGHGNSHDRDHDHDHDRDNDRH